MVSILHKAQICSATLPTNDVYPNSQTQNALGTTSPLSTNSVLQSSPSGTTDSSLKRKRSHFQISKEVVVPSFVSEGLITDAQAAYYFNAFFEGCDRYVPVFDASDAFHSVQHRSNLLLNAVCAVGCGMVEDASIDNRVLLVKLKRWLPIVVLSSHMHALETVQALLVSYIKHIEIATNINR